MGVSAAERQNADGVRRAGVHGLAGDVSCGDGVPAGGADDGGARVRHGHGDAGAGKVRVRHYDARMVVPLTWDEGGVAECAFVTRAFYRGKAVDQLQMHLRGESGYRIETVCFDAQGNEVEPVGVCPAYETGSEWPTFAIVKPAVDNTRVDMSPYGQSVFADAMDAIQAVDSVFDAMVSEVDNGKMRVFLSDVMFDQKEDGRGRKVSIPFGR